MDVIVDRLAEMDVAVVIQLSDEDRLAEMDDSCDTTER